MSIAARSTPSMKEDPKEGKPRRSAASSTAMPQGHVETFRIKEFTRVLRHRRGYVLTDDDDGRDDVFVMHAHMAQLQKDATKRMDNFLDLWAPWMSLDRRDEAKRVAFASDARWTADQLADRLRMTMAERTRLNITTIGAIDCDAETRKALRLAKQRIRQKELRRAKRERPEPPASPSARALALYHTLPSTGWRATKFICGDLAEVPEFSGLSSIRSAVHIAIKDAEHRGLVKTRQEIGKGGMPVKLVARSK